MGVRVPLPDDSTWRPARPAEPRRLTVCLLAALVFALLIANGRPLASGDTRATERVAASLVQELDFDLDEYPDVEFPFAREVGGHRVSSYPVASALLAAPVFLLAKALFVLDETGCALAGKWSAAIFSALGAAALFVLLTRRVNQTSAFWATLVFAFGTSVWSTSQALWQHPLGILALSLALLELHRAREDPSHAERAALCLALAVAARPANVFVVAVLGLALVVQFPRRLGHSLLWCAPVVLLQAAYQWAYFGSPLRHGFSGSLQRFSEPWGVGQAGLLVSPGKGLLIFTPVALMAILGLVEALRASRERWLPLACGAGFVVHLVAMGRWNEWHGGWCFGPRLLTDALPLIFAFLPDGLARWPWPGRLLASASIAIQALGAFSYDNRWERLYAREPAQLRTAVWDLGRSPILQLASERVVRLALPTVEARQALVREWPVVPWGPQGARLRFEGTRLRVTGSEANFGNVHLERGAHILGDELRLIGRWDALRLRVRPVARGRQLELRVRGRGRGTLYVGETDFWSPKPRWTSYAMSPNFRVVHPYSAAAGTDLIVTLGKGEGEARLAAVELVPPGEPFSLVENP